MTTDGPTTIFGAIGPGTDDDNMWDTAEREVLLVPLETMSVVDTGSGIDVYRVEHDTWSDASAAGVLEVGRIEAAPPPPAVLDHSESWRVAMTLALDLPIGTAWDDCLAAVLRLRDVVELGPLRAEMEARAAHRH